jgi:hypothetical protein
MSSSAPRSAPRWRDPEIDFAMVAKGFGVYSEGPISDPKDLAPALQRRSRW